MIKSSILFLLLLSTINITFSQSEWKITTDLIQHNYYLIKGSIDGKYPITMYITDCGYCGESNNNKFNAQQFKGWYYYDKIKIKMPVIGSMSNKYNSFQLYVPVNILDTLNSRDCTVKNYSEIFYSEDDLQTDLKWKLKKSKEYLPVIITQNHPFSYSTDVFIVLEIRGLEMWRINIPQLEGSFHKSKVLATKEIDNEFYTIISFAADSNPRAGGSGYCGSGVEAYMGFFHINKSFKIEKQEIIQYISCYQNLMLEIEYDTNFPEKGIRIKKD